MSAPYFICRVEPREGFVLFLTFADGTSKEVDMQPFLRGKMFEPMARDINVFRAVRIDDDAHTIVWPNGVDFAPDTLYYGLKPAWMEAEEAELSEKGAV